MTIIHRDPVSRVYPAICVHHTKVIRTQWLMHYHEQVCIHSSVMIPIYRW